MLDPDLDLLQIKIEKARKALPEESLNAIDSVDWRKVILDIKEKNRYTIEQLGDLDLETELLLCGLTKSEDYPKELESRMKINKDQAMMLTNEMNELVFKKIRMELVKNIERKKASLDPNVRVKLLRDENAVLDNAGIKINGEVGEKKEIMETTPKDERNLEGEAEMLKDIENPNLIKKAPATPILAQKLGGSFKVPSAKTEYTLNNGSKKEVELAVKAPIANTDPYRMSPEE